MNINMSIFQPLYITFYILYLILLLVGLWFLFYYINVPGWILGIFVLIFIILIVNIALKEIYLKDRIINSEGSCFQDSLLISYIVLNILAIIILMVLLGLIIGYSTVPWWIWLIFGIAIVLLMILNMLSLILPLNLAVIIPILLISFIMVIIGLTYLIIYSNAPSWLWSIFIIALIFNVISIILDKYNMIPKNKLEKCHNFNKCYNLERCPKYNKEFIDTEFIDTELIDTEFIDTEVLNNSNEVLDYQLNKRKIRLSYIDELDKLSSSRNFLKL